VADSPGRNCASTGDVLTWTAFQAYSTAPKRKAGPLDRPGPEAADRVLRPPGSSVPTRRAMAEVAFQAPF
jgi:hypothetical protein